MKRLICAILCLSVVAGLVTFDTEAFADSKSNTAGISEKTELKAVTLLPSEPDNPTPDSGVVTPDSGAVTPEPSASAAPGTEAPATAEPATPSQTPAVDTKPVESALPLFTGNKVVKEESVFTTSDNSGGKTCTITAYTGDTGVTTLYIPKQIKKKTVTAVAEGVFVKCPFLKNVVVQGDPEFQGTQNFAAGTEFWGKTGSKASAYAAAKAFAFHPLEGPAKISAKKSSGLRNATVSWQAVTGAVSYNLYRKQGNGKYSICKKLTAVSYANGGLKPGVNYTYKVNPVFVATNGDKIEGFASKEATVSMTPKKLKRVRATGIRGGIQVRWKRDRNADGYEVYMKVHVKIFKMGFGRVKTINSNKTTGYRSKLLVRGMKYSYRVRSFIKVNGKKIYSPYVTVTTRAK